MNSNGYLADVYGHLTNINISTQFNLQVSRSIRELHPLSRPIVLPTAVLSVSILANYGGISQINLPTVLHYVYMGDRR